MKKNYTAKQKTKFIKSCGNIFKDLGLKNADSLLVKAELASKINSILEKQNANPEQIKKLLGCNAQYVSYLINGRLHRFSIERLLSFLDKLEHEIEIRITKKKEKQ